MALRTPLPLPGEEGVEVNFGYDDQGLLSKDDKGQLSLRYNDFIPLLTKAVQEQQQIIEQQTSEIEAQNNNYEKLLKRIEQLEKSNNK